MKKNGFIITWGNEKSQVESTKKMAMLVVSLLLNDGHTVKIRPIKLNTI